MTKRSVKRRLIRARISLNHTVQKILDINRNRKRLSYSNRAQEREKILNEELRVLNKMAENQARLVRHYEQSLLHQAQKQQTVKPGSTTAPQQQPSVLG